MTTADCILRRLRSRGRGYVFTPKDCLDLGTRASIDQALSRLAKSGDVRRLRRGLYDYPRRNPSIGAVSPTPHSVAQAVARQTRSRVQMDGAQAANALGLSTQVPARPTFLTDGPTRRVQIGNTSIVLKHASPRRLVAPGTRAGIVVQALRFMGREGLSPAVTQLSATLTTSDRCELARHISDVPDWMRPVLSVLAKSRA
jgi:hypothetical protein